MKNLKQNDKNSAFLRKKYKPRSFFIFEQKIMSSYKKYRKNRISIYFDQKEHKSREFLFVKNKAKNASIRPLKYRKKVQNVVFFLVFCKTCEN